MRWNLHEGVLILIPAQVAGGLTALQSATVASALPFTIVMMALVWLYLGMREDLAPRDAHHGQNPLPAQPASGQTWPRRLALMLTAATEKDVRHFIDTQVRPALDQVAAELSSRGRHTEVVEEEAIAPSLAGDLRTVCATSSTG